MSVAFWSVDVTSKKAVEVQPPEGYVLNLQLAALSSGKEKTVVKASTLAIEGILDCMLRRSGVGCLHAEHR